MYKKRYDNGMKKKDKGHTTNIITLDAKQADSLGFMARPLVQVTLPHKNPGEVLSFARSAGSLRLIIQPLIDIRDGKTINYGIPYGTIPRLILAWLSTEVVQTRSKEIPLGESLSAFMRELDMIPTGGRWGTITRLREQVKRLFSSTFKILYEDAKSFQIKDFQIAREAVLFWDTVHPGQETLFNSVIVLSDTFYRELLTHPVPVDMRVLKALTKSPFALDIYAWLTYRMSYLQKETTIPWELLQEQFGADYAQARDFKIHMVKTLEKVLSLYPAKVKPKESGLLLLPSPPSVPKIKK